MVVNVVNTVCKHGSRKTFFENKRQYQLGTLLEILNI